MDPVTQSHKGLKGNATQEARAIAETRTEVSDVAGKGLVTSSLCPQDMFLNCTSDPLSAAVCLCFLVCLLVLFGLFSLDASDSLISIPSVKQLIVNSEQIQVAGLDYSGDRGTVCHSLLFGKAVLF